MGLVLKKRAISLFLLLFFWVLTAEVSAQLNLGIPDNRRPYSFENGDQKAIGVLVERIQSVCEKMEDDCVFEFGGFFSHLESLQQLRTQAVLVIDTAILVDNDNILLSEPLCQAEFFVMHRNGDRNSLGKESLKGSSIGVAYESQAHLHLLDYFYSISSIKPYGVLEAAIFDMKTNRLSAIALEGAVFYGLIAGKNIFDSSIEDPANRLVIQSDKLKQNSMRLAVKKDNEALLKRLNEGLRQLGDTPLCKELLKDGDTNKE